MNIAFGFLAGLVALYLWQLARQRLRYGQERAVAERFVKTECEPDVDDSLMGPQTNYGVARKSRFIRTLDGGRTCACLVESHFYRGGYPDHVRVYLVTVSRRDQKVVECVTVESRLPAAIVRSRQVDENDSRGDTRA